MKVPMSWFSDYVDINNITPHQFAADLTMSGSMVEGVESKGENIINVVTGKVTKIERHPDADKLVVCQVYFGENDEAQIVTGATNVFEGAIIPVARDGSTLPGGKIKKGKLRGVDSFGMMCSEEELGIATEPATGIMILPDNTPVGADIRDVLGLNESVVEFEITSNRPDCLSVIGLAREVSATYNKPFTLKKPEVKTCGDDIKNYIDVEIKDFDLCYRYTARAVKNIKIGPSPDWLKLRLEMSGVRSINNIVDITNYVMLEYGQPMHAFDIRTLEGGKIIVRRAEDGEKITTLDGVERELDNNMLVIADANKPVAVAGVMGGENSEIADDTTTILFESATFNGASVRNSAKKIGLRTEASGRYEKGLDPHNTLDAINRACELINILGAGDVIDGVVDVYSKLPEKNVIKFRPEKINAFLGTDIDEKFMTDTLKMLDFEIDGDNIYVPTYRADVEAEPDVAEEIARIYGYNNIPTTLLSGEATLGGKNEKQKAEDLVRNTLCSQGLSEIITYSFISPKMYNKLNIEMDDVVKIMNPLGEDQSIMRTVTIGSMLETIATNYNYRNEEAYLYELATKYIPREDGLADETLDIDIAMYGKNADYYVLKGTVEELLRAFGIEYYEIEAEKNNNIFHPGQTANLYVRRKKLATIGRIHPAVQKNFGINVPVYAAIIDFNLLLECKKSDKKYKKLPRFPAVTRDLAMVVDAATPVRAIEDIFRKTKTNIIESFELFDVYQGQQIGEGKKSVAYSIKFRDADKTLSDNDVNPIIDDIIARLSKELDAKIRDN